MCGERAHPVNSAVCVLHGPRLHSHVFFAEEVDQSTNADAQVGGYAHKGESKVEADAGVNLPALLDLRHSENQQPGHDDEHADPNEELHIQVTYLDDIASSLRTKQDERRTVVSQTTKQRLPRETAGKHGAVRRMDFGQQLAQESRCGVVFWSFFIMYTAVKPPTGEAETPWDGYLLGCMYNLCVSVACSAP